MITKEEFSEYLSEFKKFEDSVEKMANAILGSSYYYLFESDWFTSASKLFDIFVESHFTESGADWIYYYMFEDIGDKLVTFTQPADMFNKERQIEYHLNSIDELWEFLLTDKKRYFKND